MRDFTTPAGVVYQIPGGVNPSATAAAVASRRIRKPVVARFARTTGYRTERLRR